MVINKSLDELELITALLRDVQKLHCEVISPRALSLTIEKTAERYAREGKGFLTKALPRLGKALDKALTGSENLVASALAFEPAEGAVYPKFLGELFSRVLDLNGRVLPNPDVECIKAIRQVAYSFYKYELPYSRETEQDVIQKFIKTDEDVLSVSDMLRRIGEQIDGRSSRYDPIGGPFPLKIVRRAKRFLSELFYSFDVEDIYPRHGPGAVSTRERLHGKYTWSSVSPRLIASYPLDAYFYVSLGHVCDRLQEMQKIQLEESYAKVCLVPKDSRGPRLISCEPLAFQWIQQGLGHAIVEHVEHHPLTRHAIHFSDQVPNRIGALFGSLRGDYATLDLNEASDRVSVGLVQLLFPEPVLSALLNCRSLGTRLPNGELLLLNKFAPMGSALCFPVLALTIWALLAAVLVDAENLNEYLKKVRKDPLSGTDGFLVYGDDVIVPTAQAENAMAVLELFGLKINRDKSCTSGLFRESCGCDAYSGVEVTPVRFRTVWRCCQSPDILSSWVSYANSLYERKYTHTYEAIRDALIGVFGYIPQADEGLACPSLYEVPEHCRPYRVRYTRGSKSPKDFQCFESLVWSTRPRKINREIDGWSMLLRYFLEARRTQSISPLDSRRALALSLHPNLNEDEPEFRVGSYTVRRSNRLCRRWVSPSWEQARLAKEKMSKVGPTNQVVLGSFLKQR